MPDALTWVERLGGWAVVVWIVVSLTKRNDAMVERLRVQQDQTQSLIESQKNIAQGIREFELSEQAVHNSLVDSLAQMVSMQQAMSTGQAEILRLLTEVERRLVAD